MVSELENQESPIPELLNRGHNLKPPNARICSENKKNDVNRAYAN